MNPAREIGPVETVPLLWAEICARYPDQYVCLVDVVHPPLRSPQIVSARVVGHGNTDDEAFDSIRDLATQFPRFSVRFTGESATPLIRPSFVFDEEDLELLRS